LGRDDMHVLYAHRVLGRDRGDRGRAVHAERGEGPQIGLDASGAARVGAGDGQGDRRVDVAHWRGWSRSAIPSNDVDASAWKRRGMRPDRQASRPASTAFAMAPAIPAGSRALVTAEASNTASQPSSMAMAASDAVPTPASRTTGNEAASTMRAMLWVLRIPRARP